MLALGFMAALWLAKHLGRQDGLSADAMVDLSLTVLIAGILGSKLLMVVVDMVNGAPLSQVFSLGTLRAGGAVHGGVLAGGAAFLWRARKLRVHMGRAFDAAANAVPLGQAIGRLGCLAAGCCYGAACNMPWAITFHNHEASIPSDKIGDPLHPSQVYFALSNLAIMAALLFFRRFRKFPGQVGSLYFILEGCCRLVLETWRGDADRGFWFNIQWLSTGRATALVFILIGAALWAWSARAAKRAGS